MRPERRGTYVNLDRGRIVGYILYLNYYGMHTFYYMAWTNHRVIAIVIVNFISEKGRDLTPSYDKSPYKSPFYIITLYKKSSIGFRIFISTQEERGEI